VQASQEMAKVMALGSQIDADLDDVVEAWWSLSKVLQEPLEAALVLGAALDSSLDSDLDSALAIGSALDIALDSSLDSPLDSFSAFSAGLTAGLEAAGDGADALNAALDFPVDFADDAPLSPALLSAFDVAVTSFLDAPIDAALAMGEKTDAPLDETLVLAASVEAAATAAANAGAALSADLMDAAIDAPVDASMALGQAMDASLTAAKDAMVSLEKTAAKQPQQDALSAAAEVANTLETAVTQSGDTVGSIGGAALAEPFKQVVQASQEMAKVMALGAPSQAVSCDSRMYHEHCPEARFVRTDQAGSGDNFFAGRVYLDPWQCGAEVTLTFDIPTPKRSSQSQVRQRSRDGGFTANINGDGKLVEPAPDVPATAFTVQLERPKTSPMHPYFEFIAHAAHVVDPRVDCITTSASAHAAVSQEYVAEVAKIKSLYMTPAASGADGVAGQQQLANSPVAKWLAAQNTEAYAWQNREGGPRSSASHHAEWSDLKTANQSPLASLSGTALVIGVGVLIALAWVARSRRGLPALMRGGGYLRSMPGGPVQAADEDDLEGAAEGEKPPPPQKQPKRDFESESLLSAPVDDGEEATAPTAAAAVR